MSTLKLETRPGKRPDTTILKLDGPLLIAHVPQFQQAAQKAATPVTVLDFSNSSYMDSAGLGAVLQFYRQLTAQRRRLVLVGLNQRIAALLKLTHADTLLEILPTLDDAEKVVA
jgi:anti-sigma B factor antagonist